MNDLITDEYRYTLSEILLHGLEKEITTGFRSMLTNVVSSGYFTDTLRPKQNGWHFADDICHKISSKKMFVFWFKFHWMLFWMFQFQLTMNKYWQWLGGEQAISHCLNRSWTSSRTHICVTIPQWVKRENYSCSYWYLFHVGSNNTKDLFSTE